MALERDALKDLIEKTPDEKRKAAIYLNQERGLSKVRATKNLGISRTSLYRLRTAKDDDSVISELERLADKYPTNGFWKLFGRLRRKGLAWNHKKVYRVYISMKLNLRRKRKKRLPDRIKTPLEALNAPNIVWSMDFMSNVLYNGKRFRTLNVIDEFNRELLDIEIDTSLPAARVISVLQRIIEFRGKPNKIRLDNGPEFISVALEKLTR